MTSVTLRWIHKCKCWCYSEGINTGVKLHKYWCYSGGLTPVLNCTSTGAIVEVLTPVLNCTNNGAIVLVLALVLNCMSAGAKPWTPDLDGMNLTRCDDTVHIPRLVYLIIEVIS